MSRRFLRVALFLIACLPLQALAVSPPCPTISIAPATTLTGGTVQAAYSQTFTASPATTYVYEITSGLPAGSGLSLNSATGDLTGTPAQAGTFLMTVTAEDTNTGCSGGRTYSLDVAQANQTITFTSTAPASATVGGATYTATATSTSGLTVALTIDASATAVCSIAGSTVSFNSIGTCVIDANQAGDANFNAATQVQQSFAVAIGAQNITFTSTPPASPTVGGPTYTVTATGGGSGNPVTFTIDATATSVCSISGATVSFISAGTCQVDADQAGNANYTAAPQAMQSFAVGKGNQTITFTSTAPAAATVGGPTYNVTATATSGLTVALTIDATASSVCSITGSTVSFIGAGTCVIDANQAGDTNWNAAPQVQQSFGVGKTAQTITYTSTAPASATVGGATYNVTATASSGLTVTFTIDAVATSICSIAGSTVSFTAVGTCVIDANQAGDTTYNAAPQLQQSFAVGKGSQTITYTSTAPAGATVGGPTYTVTATGGGSGNPVTFTIDASATSICSIAGSTVSFTAVGTCVIDANQAGNANYTAATQVQQNFLVGQGSQTITFTSTAPSGATVGGPTYNVTATASSGLTVALTIDASASSVCSLSGSTVSFIGAGTCLIDANQAGNANYSAAPQAQQSFGVGQASQTITFTSTAPAGAKVGGPTYDVTATGGASGNPVILTIDASASSICSIAGSTVSFTAVGTCVIDANQAGNANYLAAPQAQQSFSVAIGDQTITFTSTAPAATVGGPTYNVTATATSGLTVTFTIDATATSVCTISGGNVVSFTAVGTCVIDADQAGDANWNPAPQAQQSFAVGQGSQTISFTSTAPAGAKVGGPTYTVTATATSGLPVTFTIDATTSSICSIAGSVVSFTAVGTCKIDANQAGNANYTAAPQAQQSFAVAKGDQTISFTSTPPPGVKVSDPAYTVTATSSAGLAVTFSLDASSTGCSLAGSSVTFPAGGTCVIDANQAGNANYNAAPQMQQSFVVAKLDQTITFTSTAPAGAKVGGATYTVTATASSGLTVSFSAGSTACSVAGSTVSFVHATTCIVDADQAGNAQYNAAPQVQQSFAVAKGDQTINVSTTAPVFGSASASATPHTYTITATATSGLTVTFTVSGACSIASPTVTFGASAGTCTINADQAGNADWNAATQVQQSTTVEIPATADNDTNSVTGNVAISVLVGSANNVLTGDTGTAIAIRSYGASTGGEQTSIGTATATAQAGSVTLNANGSYSYDPPANFTGSDTFKYIIGNDLVATSTGTVTLTITDRIIVVASGASGNCKPATPCALSTADALAAPTGKDLVFVKSGAYTNPNAAIALNANQNLVGNLVSLTQAITDATITLATESVAPAIAASTTPTLSNNASAITLGGGNLVEYFSITNSAGSAILGNSAGSGTSNIHDITVTDGANGGIGVTVSANVGTLNFSNLVVTTSSGGAFAATGGGSTINVTTGSTPNTLTSTTGTALNVTNTTIGVSGMTFQSISSSGGTATGIILDTTGASGGLTVTGDGSNTSVGGNSSGGTISNKSGADASTITGIGIYLNSTSNVVLRRMTINGTNQNYGIRAFAVNNMTLEYSTVSGTNGTTASIDNYGEGSAYFGNATNNGITGTGTFTNDVIGGGRGRNLSVVNGGTVSTLSLSVKGTTFGVIQNFGDGGDDFDVEARTSGSTINVTFGGTLAGEPNTLTNAVGNSTSFAAQAGTTMDVQFKNNTISNNNANNIIGGSSIIIQGTGSETFVISGNSMRDANGSAIALGKQTGGTLSSGQIINNTIGVFATTDSGSKSGNGIFISASGAGTISYTIKNNTIHQIHGNSHIYADNTGGSYAANFTIEGNTFDTPGAGWFAGIAVTNGAPSSGDTVNVCAKIGGTTAAEKNTLNFAGNLGVIVGSSGAAAGHTFNLPTYAGGANLTNVQNFIQGNNSGSFTTSAYNDAPATAAAFTGSGTSCPTP